MKHVNFSVYLCLLPVLFLLYACAPRTEGVTPASGHIAGPWYNYAYTFFFDAQHSNVESFATSLTDTLALSSTIEKPINKSKLVVANILTRELNDQDKQTNRIALQTKLNKQFIAHQIGSFGRLYLSPSDNTFLESNPDMMTYVQSLVTLSESFDIFTVGDIKIYEADNTTSLFAYQRSKGNMRAFIAFNFSFDTHELPLPFGFMTSTKVSMWQSDSPQLRTFVTSHTLSIRPFTAVILIVE